jgi:hypothetical protein
MSVESVFSWLSLKRGLSACTATAMCKYLYVYAYMPIPVCMAPEGHRGV